jgi:menaquinone-dependent protoporphyrinogen IX oxidase
VNIGIIVYSHSGHTLSVVERLQERLSSDGHDVTLEELEPVEPLQIGDNTAELREAPAIDGYDALVFACSVRGGTPAPPMRVYLEQVPSLEGKTIACLVTGFFPEAWGREQTLTQMKELCESKGASVTGVGSVWWTSLRRGRQIAHAVDQLSALF